MKSSTVFSIAIWFLALPSCEEKKEIVVTETRPVTHKDASLKLFATSDERFRDTQPSPVMAETPEGWLKLPSTQFRLLNYRFGKSGMGEVAVGIASGAVLENLNRWRKQFSQPELSKEELAAQRQVPIAGVQGVWVVAEGDFAGGMGAEARTGYGLAGVIAAIDGKILTVKMTGPKAEVAAAHATLEAFAASLKLRE